MSDTANNPYANDNNESSPSGAGLAQPNPADRLAGSQQVSNLVIQQIPMKLIRPNPDNRLITQDMINDMSASLEAIGLKNPVKLRPLSDGTYDLFSGHVRRLGALKLGWETIASFVMDITEEEAVVIGIQDNRNNPQTWLDDYLDIEKLLKANSNLTNQQLADRLNKGTTFIKRGKRILACLNPASRELIKQSFTKSRASQAGSGRVPSTPEESTPPSGRIPSTSEESAPPSGRIPSTSEESAPPSGRIPSTSAKIWEITESPVYALTFLEAPETVFKALQVVINRQMAEPQARKLVEWIKAGNTPESYDPKKAPKPVRPAPSSLAQGVAGAPGPILTTEVAAKLVELAQKAKEEETSGTTDTTQREALKDYLESVKVQSGKVAGQPSPQNTETSPLPGAQENKSATPQTQSISRQEGLKILGQAAEKIVKWCANDGYRIIKDVFKELWRAFKDSVKTLAQRLLGRKGYRNLRAALALVVLCAFGWVAWDIYYHGPLHPIGVVCSILWHPKAVEATPQPEPMAIPSPAMPAPQGFSGVGTPISTQPAPQSFSVVGPVTQDSQAPAQPIPTAQPESTPTEAKPAGEAFNPSPTVISEAVTAAGIAAPTTPTPVATVQKNQNDVVSQTVKQVAPGLAVDAAKKLFGL
jgi:ParB/RepB/Spo0J family partition protein